MRSCKTEVRFFSCAESFVGHVASPMSALVMRLQSCSIANTRLLPSVLRRLRLCCCNGYQRRRRSRLVAFGCIVSLPFSPVLCAWLRTPFRARCASAQNAVLRFHKSLVQSRLPARRSLALSLSDACSFAKDFAPFSRRVVLSLGNICLVFTSHWRSLRRHTTATSHLTSGMFAWPYPRRAQSEHASCLPGGLS